MKKVYLCIGLILFVVKSVSAQFVQTYYDDAIRGNGLNQFNYVGGGWVNASNTADPYYQNTVSYSNQVNNSATVNFAGSSISLYGAQASHHGIVGISIDNQPEVLVDLYAATRQNNFRVFGTSLSQGNHTLKIRVTGTKNASASNTYIVVDYIIVDFKTSFGVGLFALNSDLRTDANTAVGVQALTSDVEGNNNTAVGYRSLYSNVGTVGPYATGVYNTAVGSRSLFSNQGANNTAVGANAMTANTSGGNNSAFGTSALFANKEGNRNTAIGSVSLRVNGSGSDNVAVGFTAMNGNSSGNGNVAVGVATLPSNTEGSYNTAVGYGAGSASVYPPIQNSTSIGNGASATGSNQVRLGNADVTSIGGQVSWSSLSDGRFKKDIKEDVSGLEFIEKLRPVSYTVDKEAFNKFLRIPDSLQRKSVESKKKQPRQTGFVAQEVDEVIKKTGYVFSGVEVPQSESDHYSIRYAEFVVPLVKAVQELSVAVKEQKSEIEVLKEELSTYRTVNNNLISNSETILYQNNPNPFSVDTEIKMALPETATHAAIRIYNLEGKELKSVRIEFRGNATVKIAGNELQAGMYLYALIVDGKVIDTKRMILTK